MTETGSEPGTPLLSVRDLCAHIPLGAGPLARMAGRRPVAYPLDGVSLDVERGQTLAVIGESGSGKSTLGRTLLRLQEPTAGNVRFRGEELTTLRREELRRTRRHMQMIFQSPYASVNRRNRLQDIIAEPMRVHGIGDAASRRERAAELLELVGLNPDFARRYPHEVSGGQLQRVGIARALATEPELLVADEPTASLDVSVRANTMNLLRDLKDRLGLTLVFISHDLAVVSYVADRIAVLYLGRVVETGTKEEVERAPQHPYTQALLSAAPSPDPRLRGRTGAPLGEAPSVVDRPSGCHYHPRCPLAGPVCRETYPVLERKANGQMAACHAVPSAGAAPEEAARAADR